LEVIGQSCADFADHIQLKINPVISHSPDFAICGGDGSQIYSEVELFVLFLGSNWICSPAMLHSV
jgi:hypothetical protein